MLMHLMFAKWYWGQKKMTILVVVGCIFKVVCFLIPKVAQLPGTPKWGVLKFPKLQILSLVTL